MSFPGKSKSTFIKSGCTVTQYHNKSPLSGLLFTQMCCEPSQRSRALASLRLKAGSASGSRPDHPSSRCCRVGGRSRRGQAGPAHSRGEGDGRGLLSGLQLVAGRTPPHPDPERPPLGERPAQIFGVRSLLIEPFPSGCVCRSSRCCSSVPSYPGRPSSPW